MDFSSSGSAAAYAESVVSQIRQLSEGFDSLRSELRAVSVTASSPDRLVTVTVGEQGRVTDLTLDPRIYREADSEALADSIQSTIERAQDEAARKMAEISERAVSIAHEAGGSYGLDIKDLMKDMRSAFEGNGDGSG